MNQVNPEHLSAGIDGELSHEELRFLLRRLDHDTLLQSQWDRFHLAGDGLRGRVSPLASPAFAARVMLAIEEDSISVAVQPRASRGHWLRLSAGGAIAASVAVVALMAARPAGSNLDSPLPAPAIAQADQPGRALAQSVAEAPAAVPTSLSSNNPFRYSQRASATFGVPGSINGDSLSPYEQSLSPYQVKGYRTLQNGDGSYLLLIDPTRQSARRPVREAATAQ